MRRKFIKNGLVKAVITFSLLTFCIITTQKTVSGQTPFTPTIPPYNDPAVIVAVELNDNDRKYDDNGLLNTSDIPTFDVNDSAYPSYNVLRLPNINLSTTQDYVIGVLTNNSTDALKILPTGNVDDEKTIKVVNSQDGGFAGGLIYYSTSNYRGDFFYDHDSMLGYDYYHSSFTIDVESDGEAIGMGFLGGGNINGFIVANKVIVDAQNDATGISVQNILNSSTGDSSNGIVANDIIITSELGAATGISINDIGNIGIGSTGNGTHINITGDITSEGGSSATGIKINNIGYYERDIHFACNNYDSTVGTISATSDNSAIGVQINEVGFYAWVYIGYSLSGGTFGNINSTGGNSAIGVQINNLGYSSTTRIGNVNSDGTNTAIGIQINDTKRGATISTGDITSNSSGTVINGILTSGYATGVQIHDIGIRNPEDTYGGGTTSNIIIGDIDSTGSDTAIGLRINDIGIHPPMDSSGSIYYSYENISVGNITAEGGRSATGVQINNVGRGTTMVIGDVVAKSTSLSESGSVTGMQIGNVSSEFDSSNNPRGITINSISAISLNESQGKSGVYSYDNVYGFVLAGDLVTEIERGYYYDEIVGIGRVTITNGIIAERHGGSGDVIGLAMNGDPSGGTLTVGIDSVSGRSISVKAISDKATGDAIGIALTRDTGIPAQSSYPSIYDPQGLVVTGSIYAEATVGDAYGIRVGDDAHPNVSLGSYTANSHISAYSDSGNAYGIYSYGGGNAITVKAYTDTYELTEIVGKTGDPENKEGASIWLGGKDNSLSIGYGFTNGTNGINVKPFTVYGAQTIELDSATLSGGSFFEKNIFLDGVVSGIGKNIYDRQITITVDVPHIEKVTINGDFYLDDDGYFEGLTKEIVVTNNATVNFGKSQFTNLETVVTNDELNTLIRDLKIGIKKNDLDRLLVDLTIGIAERDNLFNSLILESEPDKDVLDILLADITSELDNKERNALIDNLFDSLKDGISKDGLKKLLADFTGGLEKDKLNKLLDDLILESKTDREELENLLVAYRGGMKNEEWAYLLDDVTKWLEKIAPVTIGFKQDGISLTQDGDVVMFTNGLSLTLDGTATFTGDQIFDGINGETTSDAYIYGDAEFVGVGNFVFGGELFAESVTVNKIYTVLAGSYASGNYAPPAYIGTQEIGDLDITGLLTVNTGTLKITRTATVGGIESDVDIKGNLITTGNIEGAKGSEITINVADGEEFVYGGSLQMDKVTKTGAGKQTVGRLKTSHALTIDDGGFAVIGSAYIAGVKSGAGTSLSKEFSVGGNLTLDAGVKEIIKVSPSGRLHIDKFIQHKYNFDGNVTAQSITKLGRGLQEFGSITTGLITFGKGLGEDDDEEEYPDNKFDLNNNLIDVDDLMGAKYLREAGELIANDFATFTGIEGDNGKFSGGSFLLTANENHHSNVIVSAVNFTKNGQGKQSVAQLTTDLLTVNSGELAVAGDIRLVSGIEGNGGQITGKNITIGEQGEYTVYIKVKEIDDQQKTVIKFIPEIHEGTEINGTIYFPDNEDHLYDGNLQGYNVTKVGSNLQSFNKLETINNLNITEGYVKLNQVIVGSQLSLAENTTLDLLVGGESSINATGELNGKIIIHGNSPQNTVAIKLGAGVDKDKFRIAFTESPDQFITWTLGTNSVYAKPNPQAYMSESYLSSLLLHDHHSAWNAVSKRLNQMLPTIAPTIAPPFHSSQRFADPRFLGQSPYNSNSNKSLWVNYVGRTGEHKSTFNNRKFKLRADGIQVGYDIIPSQSTQFGLIFGYEGQSSTANRDTVNGDDTYIGIYGAKTFTRGFDLRAIVNYGHQAYHLTRYAQNVSGYNKANYNGDTIEGILEVGKQFGLSRQLTIRPVFAVELYYNMINHTSEDDKFHNNAAVSYDVATLKQTLLRFGNDWRYEIQRLTLNGGFYYTFNCGTDKLTTIAANDFNQRLPLNGSKLGRSILSADIGGQYYINELQTRSIFAGYSGNLYPDRKGTPITGTFNIGFQFDF